MLSYAHSFLAITKDFTIEVLVGTVKMWIVPGNRWKIASICSIGSLGIMWIRRKLCTIILTSPPLSLQGNRETVRMVQDFRKCESLDTRGTNAYRGFFVGSYFGDLPSLSSDQEATSAHTQSTKGLRHFSIFHFFAPLSILLPD